MTKPIKEYHPYWTKLKRAIIEDFILVGLFVVILLIPIKYTYQKYFRVIYIILFPLAILGKIYTYLWYKMLIKRQPIVQIFENKVIFKYPYHNNYIRELNRKNVKSIILKKVFFPKKILIGIILRDPKKFVGKIDYQDIHDFSYILLTYLTFRLRRIPIRYKQFYSDKLEDRLYISHKTLELNERKGHHLFLLQEFYGDKFDDLLKNLRKVLL